MQSDAVWFERHYDRAMSSTTRTALPLPVTLRYDLRSVPFGRPHSELYSAMIEQVRWADRVGAESVLFSEHHASADGYLPSPVIAAAVVAGATSRVGILVSALLLPLYDLVRLAEDLAVLDLASAGRVDLVIGAGYRPEEYALHERNFAGRFAAIEHGVEFLRAAWTGTATNADGEALPITPMPLRPGGPRLMLGGSSPASARRAARIADGYFPVSSTLVQPYLDACSELGRAPGPVRPATGPMFVHVSEDPDRTWPRIAEHALHETNSYGGWLAAAGDLGPYAQLDDADAVRDSGNYLVLTPDDCVALARQQGHLTLHPLMGGLDPELAAESLDLVESKVLPKL